MKQSQFLIRRWLRPGLFLVVVALLLLGMGRTQPTAAQDAPLAGTISGTAFRDFDNDGTQDSYEPGIANVSVQAVDDLGNVASTTTSASGAYTTASLAGSRARVEFTVPTSLSYLRPALAGNTTVQFVNISAGNVSNLNIGFFNPSDYYGDNVRIATTIFRRGDNTGIADSTMDDYAYSASGTFGNVIVNNAAEAGDTGTTYGVAYQRQTGRMYLGAYIRRGASLSPLNQSTGSIFRIIDQDSSQVALLVDLNGVNGINTGTNPHPIGSTTWNVDATSYGAVGKRGLGDLDISEDGQTLYAINLNQRSLVIIPFLSDLVTPNTPAITQIQIPDQASCPASDFERPFALKYQDGGLYVGAVCTAEGTNLTSNLRAYVFYFNPLTQTFTSTPILEFALTYPRRHLNDNFGSLWNHTTDGEWRPWSDTWLPAGCYGACSGGGLWGYPQPMFTDIEFDNQGFMMLGFRDRLADQAFYEEDPGPPNGTQYRTRHGGDILLACLVSGTWTLENAGACNGRTTGDPNSDNNTESNYGSGPGEREFYYQEQYDRDFSPDYHRELGVGALALLPGSNELVGTIYDVFATFESGTVIMNNSTGAEVRGVQLIPSGAEFGKAGNVGDTELIGDLAFIEVGNRVWIDTDNDGVQDPGENPLSGVQVGLYSGGGSLLATDTTDASGLYYFNNATPTVVTYTVSVAVNSSTNDAEQNTSSGAMNLTSTDLEPVNDGNNPAIPFAVGVRFTNIAVPQGANITSAYIQFTTDDSPGNSAGNATFTITGEAVDDAATFSATNFDITGRADTSATVNWSGIPAWSTGGAAGTDQRTPNIGTIVQEIVNRGGWLSGNDMVFVLTGATDQHRQAESYDGSSADAAVLTITYTVTTPAPGSGVYYNFQYDTNYELRVSTSQAPLSGYSPSPADSDSTANGDLRDSDGQPQPTNYVAAPFTTGSAGDNNHTYDFGFVPKVSIGDTVWDDKDNDGVYDLPVQVGDKVWYDLDSDGLQDNNEAGVPNVTVVLHRSTDANCATPALKTTTTGDNGQYLFDNLPPGNYFVCFDLTSLPAGFTRTTANVGGDDAVDSDADAAGQTAATGALLAGTQNLTLDMGIINNGSVSVGDRVWYDVDRDGLQDTNELTGVPGVRVELYLNGQVCGAVEPTAMATTNNIGYYLFAGLPAGNYFVCFDLDSLPPNYQATSQNVGGNDAIDSDADTTTGATASTGALAAGQSNLTLDMGIRAINPTTNSLGDKVWYDQNRDGDQDGTTEPGTAGVVVELHLSGSACTDTPLATTITSQTGAYSFTGLPDGSYFVCFDLTTLPSGFSVTTADVGGDTQDSDANVTTGQTPAVALAGGTSNTTLDMGLVRTDSGTVAVGDRVWLDADRDGVQDFGEPGVPNIPVSLYTSGSTCGTSPQTSVTVTDSTGYYLFSGLPAGNYFVCFNVSAIPTGFQVTTQDAGGDDTADSDANTTTGVTAATGAMAVGSANMTLDMGIRSTSASTVSVGDLVWFDHDSDGVQDANESGVAGVRVTVYNATTNRALASLYTNLDGSYLFTGLPSASYYVIFDLTTLPAGYSATSQDVGGDTTDSDANASTGQTAATGVIPGGSSNITLDMGIRPAGTVRVGDRVWHDLDADGRQDSGEPGVAGVIVELHPAGNACTDTPLGTTITNIDGYYQFSNLPAGNYFVCFDLTSIPTGYSVTSPNNQLDDSLDSDADPSTGQTAPTGSLSAGQFDLSLDMGIYSSGNVTVGNYVWYDRDADGLQDAGEGGVSGVRVELYRNGQICGHNAPVATQTTGPNGAYLFTKLPTGSYYVCFDLDSLPAGYQVTTANAGGDDTIDSDANTTSGATAATASLTAGQSDLTLDMGIRQTAPGTVAVGDFVWYDDDRDGQQDSSELGVPGVTVDLHTVGQVCTDAPVASTTTNNSGYYLFSGLTPGNYFVCFNLATIPTGYIVTGQNVVADDGADSDASSVNGQTAATGALAAGQVDRSLDMGIFAPNHEIPLVNVTVYLFASVTTCSPTGVGAVATITTDANGNFVFPNLPAGTYYIHIPASNFGPGQVLEYMVTSTGNDPAPDPDVNPANNDDNGTAVTSGACIGGVSTSPVDLNPASEPTNDGSSDPNTSDNSSNLTADLAFFEPLSLGNLVWYDLDRDGAAEVGEPGIANVTVELYRDVNANGTCEPGGSDGTAIASQTSNGSGQYQFLNLTAGDYCVFIPTAEFTGGGDLANHYSTATTETEPDSNVENNDNGLDGSNTPAVNGVSSGVVTLFVRTEPTDDTLADQPAGYRNSSANTTLDLGFFAFDLGDLPGTACSAPDYNAVTFSGAPLGTGGDNGGRHVVWPTGTSGRVILGGAVDLESNGQESCSTVGDDTAGSDDEDGVTISGSWSDGTGNITVSASANACLNVWLDFTNGTVAGSDGDFNDTMSGNNEWVIQNLAVASGANPLSFNLPAGAANNQTFNMRVRLTPRDAGNGCAAAEAYGGTASPTGIAINGEVEDYQQTFSPTAITLQSVQSSVPAGTLPIVLAFFGLLTTITLYAIWRKSPAG